jgi:tripartite-type tricarboxylate transporter receptor subunit TctC
MHTPRPLFATAVAIAVSLACAGTANAAFPEKPITIVVPTAAGGANDAMARVIGQGLSTLLKQPVIVENKAGANGAIASEAVVKATPDGHTLMLGYIATHAMNPALQKLRYDPVKDFEPVGLVGYSPVLMVVSPSVKASNAKELVAQLKANPDKFSYASAGNGTAPHFAAELFKQSTGTANLLHVPYKGSAPAVTDTIGGQTQVMFPSLFTAVPYVKGGKLKAIGVAGTKRSPLLPDVPTLQEQGIANVDVSQWYAIFAPAKTPKSVVDQLNKALNTVLADKAVAQKLADHGADVETSTPEQLRTFVQQEQVKWKKVVEVGKLKAD